MTETGGLGEEATRLLDAAQDWLHRFAGAAADPDAGPECRYCPLCHLMAFVRHHPDRIGEFATTLLTAARSVLDALIDTGNTPAAEPVPDVEHIDIDDRDTP